MWHVQKGSVVWEEEKTRLQNKNKKEKEGRRRCRSM